MAHPGPSPRFPFGPVLALLSLSCFISYVDRGNLALAAPALQVELAISATQLGVLLSSFFWSYTLVLTACGWLVDRYDVKGVLAIGFVIWSAATALTGAAHGFGMLLGCRLLLGIGEAVTFPSYSKILARHVPQERRGLANAVIMSGMMAGPAVGTYALGHLIAAHGWRPVFVILGVASLAWVAPWLAFMPRSARAAPTAGAAVPTRAILAQRSFWAAALGHFAANYQIYFIISWLPYYLMKERGETMAQMAFDAAMFYVSYAVLSPLTAYVADRLIRAGRSVTRVRKTSMVIGHTISAIGVVGLAAADARLAFQSLVLMGAGCGICGPNIFTFAQTLAGPAVAGKWVGYQNGIANLAGVIVPPFTGWAVDHTGSFRIAFYVAAAVSLAGAACWSLLVGELRPVEWEARSAVAEPALAPTQP